MHYRSPCTMMTWRSVIPLDQRQRSTNLVIPCTNLLILCIERETTFAGTFYFMLGNIPPKLRSRLHTIQLVAVVKTELLHKYPLSDILEPFMSDIKLLESVSVHTRCISYMYYVYYFIYVELSLLCLLIIQL